MGQITTTLELPNEQATLNLGAHLGQLAQPKMIIYLYGTLGAGKTTLVRGFLQSMGYYGKVKSPTYTLVETYLELSPPIYHFDLYRLSNPEEVKYLGIQDYINNKEILLFEWPENGMGFLPKPSLKLTLSIVNEGRNAHLEATSLLGQKILYMHKHNHVYQNFNVH